MTWLKEILDESKLLLEVSVDIWNDKIIDAVNNMRKMQITYDDEQGGKGKNNRYILPVAYGLSKAGNPVIRAYETMGSSKRGLTNPPNKREFPKWKMFRVDRIRSISIGKRSFADYEDILKAEDLNQDGGDFGLKTYYAISPLCGKSEQKKITDKDKPIDSNPITKQDVLGNASVEKQNTQQKTIDNVNGTNNINNRIYAPETVPVTKDDISVNGYEQNTDTVEEPRNNNISTYTDEPVTKQEIEDPKNNGLTRAFNDMMQRWNKLERDEDEEEETEEDGRII